MEISIIRGKSNICTSRDEVLRGDGRRVLKLDSLTRAESEVITAMRASGGFNSRWRWSRWRLVQYQATLLNRPKRGCAIGSTGTSSA